MYIVVDSAYTNRDKWVDGDNVYFGPFPTEEAAEEWGSANKKHFGWWVAPLWCREE